MITQETWQIGYDRMFGYYGQDFGGGDEDEEQEGHEEPEDDEVQGRQPLSAEYIDDSDSY